MKKILAIAIFTLTAFNFQAKAQEKCLSEIMFQEEAAKNPQLLQHRESMLKWAQQFTANKKAGLNKTSATPPTYIIPVVVHVIHFGGTENISRAQIENQITTLNLDFRRLNADTNRTPHAFIPDGADCNIEFRLAKIDPNGNCTDGINRVYSPLTFAARNNVKALSFWPSDKYLNLWVVATITGANSAGDVIGFAQFPSQFASSPSTDGVVCRQDFFGSIGTAAAQNGKGRTATHEIGHWLSLKHIWGDDAGACSGDDGIADTPLQADWTLSTCPNTANRDYVALDACATTAPGFMYSNYMDYTNGNCQNIFTYGQSDAMESTLLTERINLSDPLNLAATGTDGNTVTQCANGVAPKADFVPRPQFICEGGSLTFSDVSWGGGSISRLWTFQGGTPATSTIGSPTVQYMTPGTYSVSLTVTNAAGTDTKTVDSLITVSANAGVSTIPFTESFESGTFPFNDWYLLNENQGFPWTIATNAASGGTKSLFLNNYAGDVKGPDEFITPAFDLSNITLAQMTFKLAFAYKTTGGTNTDKLVVYYSTNCGQTWTARKTINGTSFPTTASAVSFNFIPNSTQWRMETVNLNPTTISTKPNVRLRFEFTHDNGNNIYIDEINLTGTVGVDEVNVENASVNIYPNPSSSKTYVDFSTVTQTKVKIDIMDVSGRMVSTFEDEMASGDHQYQLSNNLEKGVYFVRLTFGEKSVTKKVVIK